MTNGVAIRGMTEEESMGLFLLICHRSERSEVKRSRKSMGGSASDGCSQ
ncbi:MAG: hypothetical protein NC218_11380 [Acetobacter sp.]|nr:hypothetical protein [Acetobacter sp.]